MALQPHRFVNALYFALVRRMSQEQREEFERELAKPIGSAKKATPFEAEDEAAGYAAFYAQVTGAKP